MIETFCCSVARDAIGDGNQRGLTIVPVRSDSFGDFFFLRYRVVDAQNESALTVTEGVAAAIKVDQAIKFCPWCGAEFAEVYGKNFDSLPFILINDAES